MYTKRAVHGNEHNLPGVNAMEIFKTVNGLGATVGYSVIANNAVLAQFDNFDDALKFSQATPPAPTFDKLTKANKRAVIDARAFIRHGNLDSAARLISFCIRASLRKTEKAELLYFAKFHNLDTNPDFIICD